MSFGSGSVALSVGLAFINSGEIGATFWVSLWDSYVPALAVRSVTLSGASETRHPKQSMRAAVRQFEDSGILRSDL
jgi:hypothetical protein